MVKNYLNDNFGILNNTTSFHKSRWIAKAQLFIENFIYYKWQKIEYH